MWQIFSGNDAGHFPASKCFCYSGKCNLSVGASNATKADKKNRLKAVKAEKEKIENKWEDVLQNQDSKGQKSPEQNLFNTNLDQENDYDSPEELYKEFEEDNQEVEEVYFWRD